MTDEESFRTDGICFRLTFEGFSQHCISLVFLQSLDRLVLTHDLTLLKLSFYLKCRDSLVSMASKVGYVCVDYKHSSSSPGSTILT